MEELEQAFRQVTDAANNHRKSPKAQSVSDETIVMPDRSASAQTGAPRPAPQNKPAPQNPPAPPVNPVIARNRKIAIISVCCAVAVLILSIIIGVSVYFVRTADNGLILDNIYAAGLNLGGMTPEDAAAALHRATDHTYEELSLEVRLPDAVLTLSPTETGARLDVDQLIADAYLYGRDGSRSQRIKAAAAARLSRYNINLLPYLNLNVQYIQDAVAAFYEANSSPLTQPQISVSGQRPAQMPTPSEDSDEDLTAQVHQTLTIVLGTRQRQFDGKKLYQQILDAYNHNDFQPIEVAFEMKEPEPVPMDKLVKEHCIPAVDAVLNESDFSITPEIYGYGFDPKLAQQMVDQAAEGDTVTIELTYLAPKITAQSLEDSMFQDVLAEYDSIYYLNPPRTTNLKLACAAIDGLILKPGESFSFNDTLGERTADKGYQPAGAYVDGETVDQLGGGICQVASTLYYCSLYADLEILERYEHMYSADYVPLGMDATINWGTLDYRFRNNTGHPLRIEANAEDGYVTVRLVGTDDKDYYVEMEYEILEELKWEEIEKEFPADNEKGYEDGDIVQHPFDGYIVDTYKCKYSKETDELLSREYESHSEYAKRDRIIARIPKPTEPEPQSPETPTEAPEEP